MLGKFFVLLVSYELGTIINQNEIIHTCNTASELLSSPLSESVQLWKAKTFPHLSSLDGAGKVPVLCEAWYIQICQQRDAAIRIPPNRQTCFIKMYRTTLIFKNTLHNIQTNQV